MSAASLTPPLAELYDFVVAAERYHQDSRERLMVWARELSQRLHAASDRIPRLAAAAQKLQAYAAALGRGESTERLRALWRELSEDYEALLLEVRRLGIVPAAAHLPNIKPRNLWRNLFHVATGVSAITLYEVIGSRWAMAAIGASVFLIFVGLDVLRRFSPRYNSMLVAKIFGPISRPGDAHRVPSATFYVAALALGVAVLPQAAIQLGCLVLAVGDPAAALAGKAWGKRKLWRDRSVVGSLAFVAVAFTAGSAFLLLNGLALLPALGLALVVAVAGAITELFSYTLDDNFSIPLVAGGVAALLLG